MRVFLDTNVLVSAFATRGLCADLVQVVLSDHELVLGDVVLVEFERVLTTRFNVPPSTLDELLQFLRRECTVVEVVTPVEVTSATATMSQSTAKP